MSGEKTEKPTAKKKKESIKEGQIPRTQDFGGWASLLIITFVLPKAVAHESESIRRLMQTSFRAIENPTTTIAMTLMGQAAKHLFIVLVGLGSIVMVVGVLAATAQGGLHFAVKLVKPSAKKLNPISGIKRIFGPQGLWEGLKTLIKATIVGLFGYFAVKSLMPLVGGEVPVDAVLQATGGKVLSMLRTIAIAGLAMAAADYAMARRRVGKQTRMTKEEVKQEHKQQEGDPQLKGAIRSKQLATARSRMMASIPEADVVLVNPTHIAVALRYQADKGAPVVTGKGSGLVAQRIREKAEEHNVAIVRDVPLARALNSACKVGQPIPGELFTAVAAILAFIISRRESGLSGGRHRSPRPEAELPTVARAGARRRQQVG